ncbi:MAG: WYL domain-containing protein [Coriobacteriales bacterium]|nr:WYL domain-containing protein [Coriobacteriales bacterium]
MNDSQPKKMMPINILRILQERTDAEHTLSAKDIMDILESDYQMIVDRKSVKRNLVSLVEEGFNIAYTTTVRTGKEGTSEIYSNWYYVHEFEPSELRLLIDSISLSHHIPPKQSRDLVDKLKRLSNRYFSPHVKHVASLPEKGIVNKELLFIIEVLDSAIRTKRRVACNYGTYDTDKKLKPRLGPDGKPKRYLLNPYQLASTNGRYYLVCNNTEHEGLMNLRVDRIMRIEPLDEPATPLSKLDGQHGELDLARHVSEHIYMFSDTVEDVRIRVAREDLMHVFDWFGTDVRIIAQTDKDADVLLRADVTAIQHWALQFCKHVEILEPASLRKQMQATAQELVARYQ